MDSKDIKVSANDIRHALKSTYAAPEWYIGFEVGNSTGANCRRHADAVAINAYPSKGFETRGFEIKVSKQDLKAELENGIKSDEIARFCDYWFLVVPKGLTDGFTLPPTWGVLEFIGGGLIHKVKAEKLEREAPTTGFMCAMLRGRERAVTEAAAKVTKDREEHIRRTTLFGVKNAEDELKRLRAKLAEINEATGIELSDWTPTRNIIDRLQAAKSLELIARNVRFIERGAADLLEDAREIQAAAEAILPQEAEKGDKNAETL